MTLRPHIELTRLVITSKGRHVYDEHFHTGINIIRGENSSGKSTITDMIFYVLGGEHVEWTDEAASCDWVFAEIEVSDYTFSLRREISEEPLSIAVCEGRLSETVSSDAGWSHYGRQRSATKESFSQFMFEKLGLPETRSDDSHANVTMYQVLRLIYADQNTDCTSIFRRERQAFADRQDIRRSVGEMLLGIDDLRGHELRLKYIQVGKLLSQKKSRLDSLEEAAFKTDPNFDLNKYSDMIGNAHKQLDDFERQIEHLSAEPPENTASISSRENKRIDFLEQSLKDLDATISGVRISTNALATQLADSDVFIASLEDDLSGLLAANKTRAIVGEISLRYCPLCLAELADTDDAHCPLCKAGLSSAAMAQGRLRIEQELKHQIAESKRLNSSRKEELARLDSQLKAAQRNRKIVLDELRTLVVPVTDVDPRLSRLFKEQGYITRLIEDLQRMEALQGDVLSLEKEVTDLKSLVDSIDRDLRRRQTEQEDRRNYCQERIGELTIDVLHNDIVDSNNDTLQDATGLIFAFDKDFLSVRHGRLSASTQAFLKNSFYLALLKFSIEDEDSRLPRFFILDNIEDKGMVPERFRKFHHLLTEYSKSVDVAHQVILTTSYIDDELDNSEYCVGPSYDQPPFTLDLRGEWGHFRSSEPHMGESPKETRVPD
jgi:hypothetical protein